MSTHSEETLELQTILDTMADGLFVIDTEHRILRWNRSMERLTGYRSEEAVGQYCSLLQCSGGGIQGRILGMLECAGAPRNGVEGEEMRVRRKDGSEIVLMVSARVMRADEGDAMGTVVTFTDVSSLRALEQENRRLREEAGELVSFHNLVGRSPAMREVFRLIELAAASDENILILGETGTGKELVARAIHHHSARNEGPLITVNCSALSEALLESELFGHVKGAFTGAIRDYAGRIESANGGTLFLDEIGEISPLVQVKLLRAIQEKVIERVGEGVPRAADVRIIAATHRDLRQRVREGDFREDFYYRLNVFPIRVPALREHREDTQLLATHFIRRYGERTGKAIDSIAPDAMRVLMDHAWPGNVRELENAIAHAFITCPGGAIGVLDLPLELRQPEPQPLDRSLQAERFPVPRRRGRGKPIPRETLVSLLQECGWNKAEVARRLGQDRTSVWRRMKTLGIPLDRGE